MLHGKYIRTPNATILVGNGHFWKRGSVRLCVGMRPSGNLPGNVLISLLDQLLVGLLAPGFIAMPLYSHQAPYFCQIRPDFTLCPVNSLLC